MLALGGLALYLGVIPGWTALAELAIGGWALWQARAGRATPYALSIGLFALWGVTFAADGTAWQCGWTFLMGCLSLIQAAARRAGALPVQPAFPGAELSQAAPSAVARTMPVPPAYPAFERGARPFRKRAQPERRRA